MPVFNFSAGPGGAARRSTATRRRRDARLARQRHVRDGDEPSRQGVHLDRDEGRGRPARRCSSIPESYAVLFLQGGAIGENAIVPMNLLRGRTKSTDYVNTGEWSKKSIKEAKKYAHGEHRCVERGPQLHLRAEAPRPGSCRRTPHTCTCARTRRSAASNTTGRPTPATVPLVADASSHILSRPIDVARYGVDLRRRTEERRTGRPDDRDRAARPDRPGAADHAVGVPLQAAGRERVDAQHAADLFDLCRRARVRLADRAGRRWRRSSSRTCAKAKLLYDCLDASALLREPGRHGRPLADERAVQAEDEALDDAFLKGAQERGLIQLKGHRSVGGMRASIYNAMPIEGVQALVDYMRSSRPQARVNRSMTRYRILVLNQYRRPGLAAPAGRRATPSASDLESTRRGAGALRRPARNGRSRRVSRRSARAGAGTNNIPVPAMIEARRSGVQRAGRECERRQGTGAGRHC